MAPDIRIEFQKRIFFENILLFSQMEYVLLILKVALKKINTNHIEHQ